MRRDLFWSLAFLAFPFVLNACGGTADKPAAQSPSEVAQTCVALAKVEADFISELVSRCENYDTETVELCPEFGSIDTKYEPKRAAAERECGR